MKTSLIFLTIGLLLSISSCKKDDAKAPAPMPIASFTFSLSASYVPVVVTLINTSQNAVSVLWNFGDGTNSNELNPVHTYSIPGKYEVILEAKNADGKTDVSSTTLNILGEPLPLPIVNFSYSGNTTFSPCYATFINMSENAITYLWDFGDGTTSTEQNPTHYYANGGNYIPVKLTCTNADGASSSMTLGVWVGPIPTKIAINKVTLLKFPATSGGNEWDIGGSPDPYYEIGNFSTGATFYTSEYFSDITNASLPKTYAANTVTISNLEEYIGLSLYDSDLFGNEYMGTALFQGIEFMSTTGNYPSEVLVYDGDKTLAFKLQITWYE